MNVISLFSGTGGLDLGLDAAGFQTRFAIEWDEDCRRTLALNRPSWNATDLHGGDIREFTAPEILKQSGLEIGEVDVVAGGPPCQSFSNIGRRGGIDDERGSLVYSYIRLVKGLRPKFFIFENVQGILQHPDALAALSSALDKNYRIEMRLLDAADFGVPQHRKRVIIIGRLGQAPVFPEQTHSDPKALRLNTAPWISVGEALALIPKNVLARSDNYRMNHSAEMKHRMSLIAVGKNFHSLPMNMRPNCWKNGLHKGADTFGRLDPTKPSVTIRCSGFNPTKGRYIHPFEDRGLSTAEMAAIQTFPSDYRFVGTIGSVGRQIGNAVPPTLGEHIGKAIAAQIGVGNGRKISELISA